MAHLDSPLDPPPSLEELLRPLRDRFRVLEALFTAQEAATAAHCPTALSPEGLAGLAHICRSSAELLDDLVDRLPRPLINTPVEGVRMLSLWPRAGRADAGSQVG